MADLFAGYGKIYESSADWKPVDPKRFKAVKWVATEKVHGANFCFIVENGEIVCAKRTGLLQGDEDFFGYKKMLVKLKSEILQCPDSINFILQNSRPEMKSLLGYSKLHLFGELCGGKYPNLNSNKNIFPIQTGIWYSNNIEFVLFDVAVTVLNDQVKPEMTFLDFRITLELAKSRNLLCVPIVDEGNFEQMINVSVDFPTQVPKLLHLDPISDNFAEGVVIRPMEAILVSTKYGISRAILKKKRPEFAEDSRYHQATKSAVVKKDNSINATEYILSEAICMVNRNRLNAAISKYGRISTKDKDGLKKFAEAIVEDILTDLNEFKEWGELDATDKSTVAEKVLFECKGEIIKYHKSHEAKS